MTDKEEIFHLSIKALIVNDHGHLLLLERPSAKRDKSLWWDLPGGRIQRIENPEQTLKRELQEEVGLQISTPAKFLTMVLTNFRIPLPLSEVRLIFSLYLCRISGDEPINLSDEHCGYQWLKISEAITILKPNFPEKLIDILKNMNADQSHGVSEKSIFL